MRNREFQTRIRNPDCPRCGASVSGSAKCPYCGYRFGSTDSMEPQIEEPHTEEELEDEDEPEDEPEEDEDEPEEDEDEPEEDEEDTEEEPDEEPRSRGSAYYNGTEFYKVYNSVISVSVKLWKRIKEEFRNANKIGNLSFTLRKSTHTHFSTNRQRRGRIERFVNIQYGVYNIRLGQQGIEYAKQEDILINAYKKYGKCDSTTLAAIMCHEIAHAVTYFLYTKGDIQWFLPHGTEWRNIYIELVDKYCSWIKKNLVNDSGINKLSRTIPGKIHTRSERKSEMKEKLQYGDTVQFKSGNLGTVKGKVERIARSNVFVVVSGYTPKPLMYKVPFHSIEKIGR
jgi:uncharacterized Zn finger protein (UPF0148 family)